MLERWLLTRHGRALPLWPRSGAELQRKLRLRPRSVAFRRGGRARRARGWRLNLNGLDPAAEEAARKQQRRDALTRRQRTQHLGYAPVYG